MATNYDAYMAESGQQSTLDAQKANFTYDAAKSAWESGGGANTPTLKPLDLSSLPSTQSFVQNQFAGEDAALQALIQMMQGQPKPLDLYNQMEAEAGIPELKGASKALSQEVASLEDAIYGVEGQVEGRSQESLLTEAQRQRLVQSLRDPMQEKLTRLGTSLGRIQGRIGEELQGLGTKVGLALKGQEMELEAPKLIYQTLIDRNARSLAGFTADKETALTQLISNWEQGNQLSMLQMQQMHDLALAENSYINNLKMTAAESGVTLSGGESADQILNLLGSTMASQIAWEQAYKSKDSGSGDYSLDSSGATSTITEPKPTTSPTSTSSGGGYNWNWSDFGLDVNTYGAGGTPIYTGY